MSGHDPLCPWGAWIGPQSSPPPADQCAECQLIVEARADQDEKIAQAIEVERDRWLSRFDREPKLSYGAGAVLALFDQTARIARNGGRDE